MAAQPAQPLPEGCPCRPDPGDLPVPLLNATVSYSTDPSMLTLTVDYEAGKWRAKNLAFHITEWVLDFALRREERAHLRPGRTAAALRRAMQITFGNGNDRGIPGEILLHAVCRQFHGSDTVISKVWFKTAKNDTVKGFDLVHCVHLERELQLWLGEAKFYEDLDKAIRSALSDIREHFSADYLREEFRIIAPKIEDDHPHARELRQLMHDNTTLDQVFDRIVVPVLVAYDSPATAAHDRVTDAYRDELASEALHALDKFSRGLDPAVPITVKLFLVPMATKAALLEALDKELAACL
jgi:Cap4 SAVED domain